MNKHVTRVAVVSGSLIFGLILAAQLEAQFDADKTLASLRKLDDYPLYVLHYCGDYRFGEYLKSGVRTSPQLERPPGRAEVEPWSCSCFTIRSRGGRVLVGRNFDWFEHPALLLRLMLDYADSVDRAIHLIEDYNVDFGGGPPIHYLVADRSGDSAVIEFLDGEVRALRGDGQFQVSTNFLLFPDPPRHSRTACWRYNRLSETLSQAKGEVSPEKGMELLRSVAQAGEHPTIWSCLYDLNDLEVRIAMGRNYGRLHRLGLPESGRSR
jgi:hypothetical protein